MNEWNATWYSGRLALLLYILAHLRGVVGKCVRWHKSPPAELTTSDRKTMTNDYFKKHFLKKKKRVSCDNELGDTYKYISK